MIRPGHATSAARSTKASSFKPFRDEVRRRAGDGFATAGAGSSAAGRSKENVEPQPIWLSTRMVPPCASTIRRVSGRPRPVPPLPPRKVRLEHAADLVGGDAVAGVADLHADRPRRSATERQRDPSALVAVLDRVQQQVQHRLLYQPHVRPRRGRRVAKSVVSATRASCACGARKSTKILQHRRQVDGSRVDLQTAGVTGEIVQNLPQSAGLVVDAGDAPDHAADLRRLGRPGGGLRFQIFPQQLQIELQRRQRILNFMSQPGGDEREVPATPRRASPAAVPHRALGRVAAGVPTQSPQSRRPPAGRRRCR